MRAYHLLPNGKDDNAIVVCLQPGYQAAHNKFATRNCICYGEMEMKIKEMKSAGKATCLILILLSLTACVPGGATPFSYYDQDVSMYYWSASCSANLCAPKGY